MKIYQTILILFLSITVSFSQTELTIESFLANINEEETIIYQNQKLNFLNSTSHELPYVKKLEFRTELNDFDFRKQEYLVRTSLNGKKNVHAQSKYQGGIRVLTEMELENVKANSLRERYELLVNYIYYQNILDVTNKQSVLFQDKVTLLQRSISLSDFDVLDLIEAEDELEENQRVVLDIENTILSNQLLIQRLANSTQTPLIEKEGLVSIDQVKEIIQEGALSEITNHSQLNLLSAEKESRILAYEWEQAKSKFSIGYVQAKYSDDVDDSFGQNFSIGLGFDIPLKSTDRLDLNELQLDIIAGESQYNYALEQLQREKESKLLQLQNLIQKYELVQGQLDNNQANFALERYSEMAEAPPMVLLKLKESTLNKELLLERLHLRIMQNYIDYLDLLGMLVQQPLRNYLTN